jgi:hypothetical protein
MRFFWFFHMFSGKCPATHARHGIPSPLRKSASDSCRRIHAKPSALIAVQPVVDALH